MEPSSVLQDHVIRIDHTAIVTGDLDGAIELWTRLTGTSVETRERVDHQKVEIAMLNIAGTRLELITPTTEDSGVARLLAKRGESLHHIAFEVGDIAASLAALAGAGYDLIDREARPGAHGMVAFIHPRSTSGVLIELIQVAKPEG